MSTTIEINHIPEADFHSEIKSDWLRSLTAPQDGMWELFMNISTHFEFTINGKTIGYACLNDEAILLQFYMEEKWAHYSQEIFSKLLEQENINTALVGTNNPVFLSAALPFQKSVQVNTLLFTELVESKRTSHDGLFRPSEKSDHEKVVDFCHLSMGAPKEWLQGYLGNLIQKEELFQLEDQGEILGTCEVRKSDSQVQFADVGMVVSPNHRKKGIGTFLLGQTIAIAKGWDRQAICSCEADNIGSLKAIQNNGFRSKHQLLLLAF